MTSADHMGPQFTNRYAGQSVPEGWGTRQTTKGVMGDAQGRLETPSTGIHANPAGPVHPYFPGQGTSQGKFFTDPKPEDSARWPRGYTRERMADVKSMPLQIRSGRIVPFSAIESLPDNARLSPGQQDERERGRQALGEAYQDVRRARETVARSTIPADALNPGRGTIPETLRVTVGTNLRSGIAGQYDPHEHRIEVDPGFPGGTRKEDRQNQERQGQTLIHELGHANSALVNPQRAADRSPAGVGSEEARADDYRVKNWRPDPRDVRAGRSQPPHSGYEESSSFQRGYYGQGADAEKAGTRAWLAYRKARRTRVAPSETLQRMQKDRLHAERGNQPRLRTGDTKPEVLQAINNWANI